MRLLAACGTTRAPRNSLAPPRSEPSNKPTRVALVLFGGAVRGFAHIGVRRALERESLLPDLIVGTSAGAIVGALWAAGVDSAGIERLAARMDLSMLLDVQPWRMLAEGVGPGLAHGERLEQFLRDALPPEVRCRWTPRAGSARDACLPSKWFGHREKHGLAIR